MLWIYRNYRNSLTSMNKIFKKYLNACLTQILKGKFKHLWNIEKINLHSFSSEKTRIMSCLCLFQYNSLDHIDDSSPSLLKVGHLKHVKIRSFKDVICKLG